MTGTSRSSSVTAHSSRNGATLRILTTPLTSSVNSISSGTKSPVMAPVDGSITNVVVGTIVRQSSGAVSSTLMR